MTAFYNEIDPYAAQWLRNLIEAGHIAPGVVDERSIEDIHPNELAGFTQCHFFAGIGAWSLALRKAGWHDDKPVWTGSCPCQPFSTAGQGAGFSDERHLWPAWFHLITQRKPERIFGEQVASKDGLGWLDLVQTDLEAAGYANAAVDICAAGGGAPHIRQRLWFSAERLADTDNVGQSGQGFVGRSSDTAPNKDREVSRAINASRKRGLADTSGTGFQGSERERATREERESSRYSAKRSSAFRLADADCSRSPQRAESTGRETRAESTRSDQELGRAGATNGMWSNADWLLCRDGKWRPVESGTFPLVNGAPSRVGRLRAYGNCINVEAAKIFIEASMSEGI